MAMEDSLTEAQVDAFRKDGFVVLPDMFNPSVLDAARPSVKPSDMDAMRSNPHCRDRVVFGNASTGEDPNKITKLEGLRDVTDFKSLFGLTQDIRFQSMAKQLLGPHAELMKDKYIFKQAGQGHGFTPHQDMQYAYHRFAIDAINFYIAFDDADADNGALEVAGGLQRQLHGNMIVEMPESGPIPEAIASTLPFKVCPLRKGDVLLFSAWVPHRSQANVSDRDRAVYYPTYGIAPEARRGKLYDDYYEYAFTWWGQQNRGDPRNNDTLLGADKPRPTLHPGTNGFIPVVATC
eukprot:m.190611 g.190611  ORF g.190611 m.190611 type:complete len:292 (+) comp18566_c0_seq1:37-912(+)